jgi:sporulation protein YlmC with PRC-barrel domain
MKLKATLTALFFLMAASSAPVLAADHINDDFARGYPREDIPNGALEARPGTPMAGPAQDLQHLFFEDEAVRIAGMHRANELVGQSVVSREGDNLGTIDDLAISDNGQVEYIVLSRGGFLGLGAELLPIPWEAAALQWDAEGQLTAGLTEQQIQGAPTFKEYAQFGQEYEQQVHGYFDTEASNGL